jgi:hypothetical protein
MKKLSQKDIEELIAILEHRRKLRIAKEFITNKYIFIPLCMAFVYLVDNPNIVVVDFVKKILSKFI